MNLHEPDPADVTWAEILRRAQNMPVLWIWSQDAGHLLPISRALRAVWEKRAFENPETAQLWVSTSRCLVSCKTGPVIQRLAPLLQINESDVLLRALDRVEHRIIDSEDQALRRFRDATFHFGSFAHVLYLAEYGACAIRDSRGLWCQSYQRGWPVSPPVLIDRDDAPGLMVMAALSPKWFRRSYSEESVREAIPYVARKHVRFDWLDRDELLPDFSTDPETLLNLKS